MNRLFESYRTIHDQAFIPIFVHDDRDARTMVEACVAAGAKAIEYTMRRPDAREMIPWIRKNYPDLILVVGSTLDSEKIVAQMRGKHPQLMSIPELVEIGVDGFVSMLGWRLESIARYAPTHIVVPSAQTATEALLQVDAGAHMIKMSGNHLDLVRTLRLAPTFDFCPIFVTGNVTLPRIPEIFKTGAITVATGFDVLMREQPAHAGRDEMADVIKTYLETARTARAAAFPELRGAHALAPHEWLHALPHYHPFSTDGAAKPSGRQPMGA